MNKVIYLSLISLFFISCKEDKKSEPIKQIENFERVSQIQSFDSDGNKIIISKINVISYED